jgi:hypothetical protein
VTGGSSKRQQAQRVSLLVQRVREELVAIKEVAPTFHAEVQEEVKKVSELIPQVEDVLDRLDRLL